MRIEKLLHILLTVFLLSGCSNFQNNSDSVERKPSALSAQSCNDLAANLINSPSKKVSENLNSALTPKIEKNISSEEFMNQAIKSRRFWLDPAASLWLEANSGLVPGLARLWYQSEMFPQMIYPKVVSVLGEKRAHLMLDPRILCRLDDFLKWSTQYLESAPLASASELRSEFASSLGTSKIFRGMRLSSQEQAENIKDGGIRASALLNQDEVFLQKKMESEIDPGTQSLKREEYLVGFGTDFQNRQMGRGLDRSMLISASDWIEIAASVGYHHKEAAKNSPIGNLYLYEIEIPEFEIIRKTGALSNGSAYKKGSGGYQIGEKWIEYDDAKIEVFIPYEIKSEWILAVHRYENPPPVWEYRK